MSLQCFLSVFAKFVAIANQVDFQKKADVSLCPTVVWVGGFGGFFCQEKPGLTKNECENLIDVLKQMFNKPIILYREFLFVCFAMI